MYPSFPPFTQKGHNVALLTQGRERYFRVTYAEQMPGGSQSVINFGAPAASATIAKAVQALIQIDADHLLEIKLRCIDDIEVAVWVPGGTPMFFAKNWSARVTLFSGSSSPPFYVYGADRDAQFEVTNPRETALATARAALWGWHYVLELLATKPDGPVDWAPAQGYGGT